MSALPGRAPALVFAHVFDSRAARHPKSSGHCLTARSQFSAEAAERETGTAIGTGRRG